MPAQHRTASPRYRKPMILAGLLVPVLVLAGIYLVHIVGGGKSQASTAADTARMTTEYINWR